MRSREKQEEYESYEAGQGKINPLQEFGKAKTKGEGKCRKHKGLDEQK